MNARYQLPFKISPAVVKLLKSMLEANPKERLSSAEIWSVIDGIREGGESNQPDEILISQPIQNSFPTEESKDKELGFAEVRSLFSNDLPTSELDQWVT